MTGPAERWKELLEEGGYEHSCTTDAQYHALRRLTRTWRLILRVTGLKPPARCFEAGCGGGIHLVRLALNAFICTGIDVSPEVLVRARRLIESVRAFDYGLPPVELLEGDFMTWDVSGHVNYYDLVFSAGVIEHYLEEEERLDFLRRKLLLAKPGGFIASIVPAGTHPYREEQKQQRWGGYNIPEVDYDPLMLTSEMRHVGVREVMVLPHNVFGYILARPSWRPGWFNWLIYGGLQVVMAVLPPLFRYRHAYSFIMIGRKP